MGQGQARNKSSKAILTMVLLTKTIIMFGLPNRRKSIKGFLQPLDIMVKIIKLKKAAWMLLGCLKRAARKIMRTKRINFILQKSMKV